MQSRITGTTMPVLEFALEPNESIISEAGELSWMGSSIQMTTHTQFGGGGGLFGVLKRVAGGGSIFMTEYRALGAAGRAGVRDQAAGAHCSRRSIGGTRISDSSSRIFVWHSADSDRPRLSAIAWRGNFRRQRICVAAGTWTGHVLARTLRRTGDARSAAGRNAARASRTRWRISVERELSNHDCPGHQESDLRRRRNFSGGSSPGREESGCKRCRSRSSRMRSRNLCRIRRAGKLCRAAWWVGSWDRFWIR